MTKKIYAVAGLFVIGTGLAKKVIDRSRDTNLKINSELPRIRHLPRLVRVSNLF